MTTSGWQRAWRRLAIGALLRASGSAVPGYLREFAAVEKMNLAGVDDDQHRRLTMLLRHCYEHVPYYQRILEEAAIDLRRQVTITDLKRLPLLTKDIIRREGKAMLADDRAQRKPFENSSGGSTGVPLVFVQDQAYFDQSVITAKLTYNRYFGKSAGDPEIKLWGSERDILRGRLSMRERIQNYIYNRTFQNAFLLDQQKLAQFVVEINRRKPVSIWVYVESIDLLARYIRDNNLSVHKPRFILSTAGTLYPEIRETAQQVFGCPVYNQYGSREVGAIAFEMRDQNGMRGLPYLNYVELVDSKIVITNLTNYSMPLLRYEIGDTAEAWEGPQDLAFGCEKKIFKTVTGRISSHFKTAAGGMIHGEYFVHLFYFLDWVGQFQIIQNSLNEISCRVVATHEPNAKDIDSVRNGIYQVMGPTCEVSFEFVDTLTPGASGKHMYTICNI